MTDTPAVRKPGRPATGRDPVVSIRLPKHLIEQIDATARHTKSPAAKVYREALHLGLEFMKGERVERGEYLPPHLRPKHAAEVHEAGHAVVMFLCAIEEGTTYPYNVIKEVSLQRRGAGLMRPSRRLLDPEAELRMFVAGAVAEAIDERASFLDIRNGHQCSGDRKNTAKLLRKNPGLSVDSAAAWVEAKFEDPDIWTAVAGLARELEHGKVPGSTCWQLYKANLEGAYAQRDRAAEHMGPVVDEDVVKRPRRRVAKKKPRSRR